VDSCFGEGDKLVWLLQLTLGCVIHERSVLQGYKEIAGPTAHASFQFSRKGARQRIGRGSGGRAVIRTGLERVLANRIWMGIVSASDQTQLHSF
jgi:hypothetical protein